MKKILFAGLVIILFFTVTSCKKTKRDIVYDRKYLTEIKELRKEIFFYMSRNFIPGGNFAISKKGKIIYSEGIGLASTDLDVRATRTTKFRIGETSEIFTALTFRLMAEKGVLHPDSSIQNYLPDFPVKKFGITPENLVNETSGIREPGYEEADKFILWETLQKGIDRFKNDSLAYPTGYYQLISPFNYNLLGAIMEKASGKTFSQLIKEYVTDTLHLENTVVDNPFATIKGRADFHDNNLVSQVVHAVTQDLRSSASSKGILSCAEDLVKLGNAVLYSKIIPDKENYLKLPALKGDMPAQFGNGWIISIDRFGRSFYGRTGNVTGGGSAILIYPDEEVVVAGAVNLSTKLDEIPVFEYAQKFMRQPEVEKN